MPAIRDVSWATTTVATGTTLVIPTPAYEQNDLFLAVFMADTGTATWTSTGWTHVTGSPSTNTAQLVVMWKIAGSSEAATFTFTASAAESFNGCIISIRDVDTTNPFGSTPVVTFANQASAAKFSMPSITTNVANALIIYASANSAVGVPSLIEGPVFGLIGADGLAESLGVGWGFKPTTGATSTSVVCSNVASGAGRVVALQVVPPTGGAQVIPAYCAADASIYVNPLNGTTAFNGDTGMAATADTGFSTTLGGLTAADATIAAQADVGINSFHSAARVTSISASTNLSGVELVLATANRPDVTGKNVLVHTGPSTEGQLQRYSSVASGRGIWFGMRSAAASNWKIWQVHGRELGAARHQPVVINEGAGNTKSTNGTLSPSAIHAFGFWTSGTGVTTTVWDFASLWVLDTVTIAGGNAAEPVGIAGIVSAAADGHERRSVIRQGADQALAYQPIKLGDGGTSPIYLDLNATAIEFPSLYNAATKQVTYNSVANVAGLTYHGGSSDTIKHRNSVVSSASQFHWRVQSGAAGSYDFDGLQVIGAGDVQLRDITIPAQFTYTGMSFSRCGQIAQNSAYIESCVVSGSVAASALLAGNPGRISDCTFVSGGTGHAIEITTAGTYTFDGNSLSGYGPNVFGFHTTNDVNGTTDVVTRVAHGYTTGKAIEYRKQGGTAAIGLTDATTYYVRAVTTDTIAFYTSSANAIADTSRINLTASGTDTHYISSTDAGIYNNSGGAVTINVTGGGSTPTIRNGASATTTVNNSVTITLTNLIADSRVYIRNTTDSVDLFNQLEATTTFSQTVNYTTDKALLIRIRNASGTTKYKAYETTGTLTATGFSLNVNQELDQ